MSAGRPVSAGELRVGLGFDVHRLVAGRPLWLGGVSIAHPLGLDGHSDADVLLHAVTDAVLGAIGAGDIGAHFPPGEAQYARASSATFVERAMRLAAADGWSVVNVDTVLMAEAPPIGPHRDAMRSRMAELLRVQPARVGVKATTLERLGPIGAGEAMAAQAVVLLRREGVGHAA